MHNKITRIHKGIMAKNATIPFPAAGRTGDLNAFQISTRQHPQGGGREALSNPFWFIFITNVQYEYNWIRLRQLTYLSEIQKWTKFGTPLPGISALKSVSGGPFLGHLLIWPDAGAVAAAAVALATSGTAPAGAGAVFTVSNSAGSPTFAEVGAIAARVLHIMKVETDLREEQEKCRSIHPGRSPFLPR